MMMIITRGGEGGGGRGRGKFPNKIKQKKVDECLHLRASAGHRMRSADYPPRNRSQTHTHTHIKSIKPEILKQWPHCPEDGAQRGSMASI